MDLTWRRVIALRRGYVRVRTGWRLSVALGLWSEASVGVLRLLLGACTIG